MDEGKGWFRIKTFLKGRQVNNENKKQDIKGFFK